VLTNPGGPGADGRFFPAEDNFTRQTRLREHQEIVGIDVRGTGRSTNVTCDGAIDLLKELDARNRDPHNLNHILDTTQRVASLCQQALGDLGPVVNTYQTVRDLDLLRILLGRDRINWVGYSGGSWLGAHYAQQFPQHTGRIVLDSNAEFTTTWQRSFDWQSLGFERRWREDFLPWMAGHDSTYHFGTTGDAVRQVYERVRDALTRTPVDVGTVHVTAPKLDELTVSFLYQKSLFPTLANILVTLRDLTGQGTADIQEAQAALTKTAGDSMRATFWAILCGEGPWTGNRQTAIRDSNRAYNSGLTLIGGAWPLAQLCMFWTTPARPLPTMDGNGVPPVLMLQSTHDPATPIEGARRAHAAFANSRMVTVTDEGDHGLYGFGNQALDTIVNDYLVNGTIPADQSVPGMPLPTPGA